MYLYQNKKEMQITSTVLVSATSHMEVDSIYNYLLPLPISLPSVLCMVLCMVR